MIFQHSSRLRPIFKNTVRSGSNFIVPPVSSKFRKAINRRYQSDGSKDVIKEVREALSLVTHPGCKGNQGFNGITVSSVTSLSLSPLPLLTFNIRLPSSFSTTLHETKLCSINTLTTSQAEIATLLSKPKATFDKDAIHKIFSEDLATGIPFLSESLISFLCKIHSVLVVADHEIWVVEPIKTTLTENTSNNPIENNTLNKIGLLYGNRTYLKAPISSKLKEFDDSENK